MRIIKLIQLSAHKHYRYSKFYYGLTKNNVIALSTILYYYSYMNTEIKAREE